MEKIIIVGGPTGSGKTKFAIKLAKDINGELINADSRQIYKYLNIGTNKGVLSGDSKKYIDGIPIHLIDFLKPDVRFNVFEWRSLAINCIKDIQSKGKQAIVVGGTGLYIDSLIKEYDFESKFQISDDQRKPLTSFDNSNLLKVQEHFKTQLTQVWDSLNYSDQNNLRRLQRLITKLSTSEKPVTNILPSFKDYTFYYPKYNWDNLKMIIENRVDEMFKEGLVEETRNVLAMGYDKYCVGLQVMGYKEVIRFLDGEINLEKCIELVKYSHKQYARRQRTWFEGEKRGYRFNYFKPISS